MIYELEPLILRGVKVAIFCNLGYGKMEKPWQGKLEHEADGIKVEVNAFAVTMEELVEALLEKWKPTTQAIPNFAAPILEHKTDDYGVPF